MGGYGPQIAQGMINQGTLNIQHNRELQDEQRKQNLELNWGVINNPNATPEQKQAAQQSIQGLYPTPFHAPQFLQDLMHLKGRKQQAQSAANVQPNPSVPASVPAPGDSGTESTTPGPANVQNPVQIIQGGAAPQVAAQGAPLAQLQQVAQAASPQEALTKIKGGKPQPDVTAYASPAQQQNALNMMAQEAITKRQEELANIRGGYQVEAAKARGMLVRPVPNNQGAVALDDARRLREAGQEFLDRDGEPIDLDELKSTGAPLKLVPIISPRGSYWMVANQKARLQTIGNQVVTLPETGTTTEGQMASLGTKNLGAESTHQVPGALPGEKVALTSTRTPATGNIPPAGTAAGPVLQQRPSSAPAAAPTSTGTASAAPPKMATAPLSPPALPAPPSAKAVVAKVNQGRSQSKQIPEPKGEEMPPAFAPGTLLQQAKPAMPVVSAMSVVASNIFGSHGDKPIWDNAWMYDKPELRKALNNALTLNALHIPGTEDNPSLLESLKTAVGATQWSQEQINDAAVQARQEVERLGGPEALKQFNRMAAMQEDLSALRAATKASAAQGSLNLAVRAAPVYNISSAQDFRNQLGTMLATATSSMHGYPGINPAYVNWWDKGVMAAKHSRPNTATGRGVSLRQAMALPFNQGKTEEQVRQDIIAHGHQVVP